MNKELENVMTEEQEFTYEVGEATINAVNAYEESNSDESENGLDLKSVVIGGGIGLAVAGTVKLVKWGVDKIKNRKIEKEEKILAKAEEISKKRETEKVVDVDEDDVKDCDSEDKTDEEIKDVQEQEEVKKPEKKKK